MDPKKAELAAKTYLFGLVRFHLTGTAATKEEQQALNVVAIRALESYDPEGKITLYKWVSTKIAGEMSRLMVSKRQEKKQAN